MRKRVPGQLSFHLRTAEADAWIKCKDLFSLNYLRRHIQNANILPPLEAAQRLHAKIKALWEAERYRLSRQPERYTCSVFLEPILADLGWLVLPEKSLPSGQFTRKRPDFCLFTSAETRDGAAGSEDPVRVFSLAATVLEAKQFGHPLDRESQKETKGWFPSQQIQDYLRHAKDSTGRRFFNWAILTNGEQWRLYCEQAGADATFSFNLAHGDEFCGLEDFRLFMVLFGPAAFEQTDGKCLLDELRTESVHFQVALETSLRRRIFYVLEDLANGYRQHAGNAITDADLGDLFRTSLVFLYRLLFVLYAESRGLLPAKARVPGANKLYRENFSLDCLVDKLRDKTQFESDAFETLYERLLKLFHLINGDRPEQNEKCGVTRYNGGLFDHTRYPLIDRWRIGDKTLANVLRQLLFAQPPARASAKQQEIATDEAIDYGTLEVRQLGDIYEGLLGAHLEKDAQGRLLLKNARGKNHNEGIFYTPDWVVEFLVRESLQPLLDEIEASPEVQKALAAKSEEKRRDDSFAHGVLKINVLDPAMGSGHLLVRAVEYLARRILEHDTTRRRTEQVVTSGKNRRTKAEIERDGAIPVHPAMSQEDAERAYWRRRVVEACIYGVDMNPDAVELAKFSLWLTCIAADEPLNFLDHHLRCGNSLLFARATELDKPPLPQATHDKQAAFSIGDRLTKALQDVIAANVNIEEAASTEMEIIKAKEQRWKAVRGELEPFLRVADLWIAALNGLPVNELDYRQLALLEVAPDDLSEEAKKEARKQRKSLDADIATVRRDLAPFHWELEFPDVFFEPDGKPRPAAARGFDAIFGNPPYITRQTMSGPWVAPTDRRLGYAQDTYEWFTRLGFDLLRPGGTFGFITADTYFTLGSFSAMRELLQSHRLLYLGQCDPFEATVDAAIFVARKRDVTAGVEPGPPEGSDAVEGRLPRRPLSASPGADAENHRLIFIQARPRKDANGQTTQPEKALPLLQIGPDFKWTSETSLSVPALTVAHSDFGPLRLHSVPVALYRAAHKRVFFEPRHATLKLFERFNDAVKRLTDEWWDKIETSAKFAENIEAIRAYHNTLKPGDITLVGLIAEGGQGLASANNARFLGYLEGTPQSQEILVKREKWTRAWLQDERIRPVFERLLRENGGDPRRPTADGAAWEACIEPMRNDPEIGSARLGFTKSDLYRIVPRALVANEDDFKFAFQRRKEELLKHWQSEPGLKPFWEQEEQLGGIRVSRAELRKATDLSDAEFCRLCVELNRWVEQENARRKTGRIAKSTLGLRSSEFYEDPADAPRIAAIYNGLSGRGRFVPFRKGDPEGNRWIENDPLFIDWSASAVRWLFDNSGHKGPQMPVIRNPHTYLTSGIAFSRHGRDVALKFRFHPPSVYDAASPRFTSAWKQMPTEFLLAVFNSFIPTCFIKKFLNNTWYEMTDLRMMPVVVPTRGQEMRIVRLATAAIECKRLTFTGDTLTNEQAAFIREVAQELVAMAPAYLRPPAQQMLLQTAADGLAILELAVNWEAEKLYGVEGLGPFDEF